MSRMEDDQPDHEGVSSEVRSRAVRIEQEHGKDRTSRWAVVVSVAGEIGCSAHNLNDQLKKAEVDSVPEREYGYGREAQVPGTRGSSDSLTRSCADLPHISPRRSSTARSSGDWLH